MDALLPNRGHSPRSQPSVRPRRRSVLECDALEDRRLLSMAGFFISSHAGLPQHQPGLAAYAHRASLPRGGRLMMLRHAMGTLTPADSTFFTTPVQTPATATAPATTDAGAQNLVVSTTTAPPSTPMTTPAPTTLMQSGTTSAGQVSTLPVTTSMTLEAPPASNPQASADFQKLKTDMHAILAKSQVTVAEQVAIHDDLQAIDRAATSAPSTAAEQAFQNDLKALDGSLPTDAQKAQLEADYTALVKSRGVTDQSLIDKTISDAEAIVASSNITPDDLATIAADRQAIATDLGTSTADGTSGPGMDLPISLGGLLSGGKRMIVKSIGDGNGAGPGGPLMISGVGSMMGDPMAMGGPVMFSRGSFGKGGVGGGGMGGGQFFRGML